MKKQNPIIFDDAWLYACTPAEVNFTLNSRRIIDRNCGDGFDEGFVKRTGCEVGFYLQSAQDAFFGEETVFLNLVRFLSNLGVQRLFAIPTGYPYKKENSESVELTSFDPPLVGKTPVQFERVIKIRGSMIGLYSQEYLIFSDCLRYAVMDFNGYHSMIMGPRPFVEEILGMSVEDSWKEVRLGTSIEPQLLDALRKTMTAYGY